MVREDALTQLVLNGAVGWSTAGATTSIFGACCHRWGIMVAFSAPAESLSVTYPELVVAHPPSLESWGQAMGGKWSVNIWAENGIEAAAG